MKRLAALLATAALAATAFAASARAAEPGECEPRAECFGLESVALSLSSAQAGAHSDFKTTVELKQDPETPVTASGLRDAYAATRDIAFDLPPGLIGNPNVVEQCAVAELAAAVTRSGDCPNGSQIGLTRIYVMGTFICEPVYMMVPPGGDVVARLGFIAAKFPVLIDLRVRSESDYGLTGEINDAASLTRLVKAETTIWGVPADPSHDTERLTPFEAFGGACASPLRPPGLPRLSFFANPTSCGAGKQFTLSATSWPLPNRVSTLTVELPPIVGCEKPGFGPGLSVTPTSRQAAAPTGLDATLTLPQQERGGALATSHLRSARVTLPEGMTFAPGAADGLEACGAGQVGVGTREPSRCPDAAKLGSAEIDVPALARPIRGAIYLRTPDPGNLFRIWLVSDDLAARAKLPGEIELDPKTGEITSIFVDNPQVPLRELKLHFKSGFRAPLANPPACGTYLTHYEFTPWSGTPPVAADAPMTIDRGCDTGGFSPKLSAGTTSPAAGSPSPFLFNLTREDGEQNPAALDIAMPPGLVAKLKGVPLCEGAAAETGNCPPASKVGTVTAATGPGPAPLWVPQPGKDPTAVYLAGPYAGAPLSIVAAVPAQAGPFDLGTVVVRSAVHVDPETAQVTVESDPLPQILEGIPITYRTIRVAIDRLDFTRNPTNCEPMAVAATVASDRGATASPASHFQASGCHRLGLKPRLFTRLLGGTKRGAHPRFRAVLMPRKGDANLARVVVRLPRSAFLDQGHIRTVCTRAQFAAENCPKGAVYGRAKAFTPLLDEPLEGLVYLRSSDNLLPNLVASLKGQIDVDVVGRIDSVGGGIRSTFEAVPDAPVGKFVIEMQGGRKGLLVNSRDLCKAPSRAVARFTGHNGRRRTLRPKLKSSCGKRSKKQRRNHKRHSNNN